MSISKTEAENMHQEEETSTTASCQYPYQYQYQYYRNNISSSSTGVSEIEEEENSTDLFEINHGGVAMESVKEDLEGSLFSYDVDQKGGEDCVYVGVGKSESSLGALSWTLKNAVVNESTIVYLIHVFPEIHHIPSPLGVGKIPRSQVSPEQVESYMAQERAKRRELLQKFINMCSASKVKVDTILVESDMVGKAIVDLIPILNMRKLVLGTNKSNLRKLRSRKGSGIADQILQNAPEFCEIKIICDGKEVMIDQMIGSPSPVPSSRAHDDNNTKSMRLRDQSNSNNDSYACMCFKSPRVK